MSNINNMLTAVAYLDDIDGMRLVLKKIESSSYILIQPPAHNIEGSMEGEWVLDSAMAHGFEYLSEPISDTTIKNVINSIRALRKNVALLGE